MPTKAGIYKITSPSGKIYIGQTWDMKIRLGQYKNKRCSHQRKLHASILKYGWENHSFELIHELPNDVSQKIMNEYEIFYYNQYLDAGFKMLNIREPGNSRGKHSEETKQLMCIAQNACRKRDKKVYQYSLDGKFIKEWANAVIAARQYNIYATKISDCIKERAKSTNGFMWKNYKQEIISPITNSQTGSPVKIIQFDKNNNKIKEWDSASEASRILKITKSSICHVIKGERKTAGKFIWRKAI